jgi:transcriptional regulator with XRE-family HTH domain
MSAMRTSPERTEFYRQLGENIRKTRRSLKLSQDELARAVGLTRTSLTNIENGRQHPPLHTFCDLVEQLKVGASALLPNRVASAQAVDVEALASQQVRGKEELAFIATGIGVEYGGGQADGYEKKKNRVARRKPSN